MARSRTLRIPFWRPAGWKNFIAIFVALFAGSLLAIYLGILWLDPYGIRTPLSERVLQYGNQRTLYPQIVRSKRFDSYIVGTSTARLIDPQILNGPFAARFANLSMNSMLAWEQKTMIELIIREAPAPKVLIIALDGVWCEPGADTHRFLKEGFPDWLYDGARWNDYLYLLNDPTARVALRQVLYRFGLVSSHVRDDGFGVFTPPETQFDISRAREEIWRGAPRREVRDTPPPRLSDEARQMLRLPALNWLDELLAQLPATRKILAFMPIHVAGQPSPASEQAAREGECKTRIAGVARTRGATLIDWRYPSALTREDSNYWDVLHYRLPVAERVARDLAAASLNKRASSDGTYRIIVP
jgi:hypothetical protein